MSIAFFDVDGTLLPFPSLERRLVWNLFRLRQIPAASCLRWVMRSIRLGPWNLNAIARSNKAYLCGVPARVLEDSLPGTPEFFSAAVQRVWWHALRGDTIVLLTGTLAPLAGAVKFALERELLWRGVEAEIHVVATQLQVINALCTGRVLGEPMFGKEKAIALRRFAAAAGVTSGECFAYGDHHADHWMLTAAGKPFAVNPTRGLRRIARDRCWPILAWTPCSPRTLLARNSLKWKGEAAR